ncbi:MAG: 4-hydroxythreonine-4-phosphate dehydrogenase PdxA, partial [Devosiaceae bacterium]|nr:4-hydroxythreonine-4-phosphate dehydrogenase PdxA [Devosiaceae bacterium]
MKNKPLPIAISRPLPIAISMGEPAGIGLDLIIELYSLRNELNLPPFIVYGNSSLIRQRAKQLGKEIAIVECLAKDASSYFANSLPIFNIGENFTDSPKTINKQTAKITIQSIEKAVEDNISGLCRALVTAPIQKSALYDAGFKFPGHTEFLASLCKENGQVPFPIMMLAHENLRVVPLT